MLASDQRKDRRAVQLLPNLIKGLRDVLLDPGLGLLREVQRRLYAMLVEQGGRLRADAPDFFDRPLRQEAVELPAGNGGQA